MGFDHLELEFCYWEWEIKSPWCEWDLYYQRLSSIGFGPVLESCNNSISRDKCALFRHIYLWNRVITPFRNRPLLKIPDIKYFTRSSSVPGYCLH